MKVEVDARQIADLENLLDQTRSLLIAAVKVAGGEVVITPDVAAEGGSVTVESDDNGGIVVTWSGG